MSVTVGERPGGVTYEDGRLSVEYVVKGTTDEAVARAAVEAYAPATRNGLGREVPSVEETEAEGLWMATVTYVAGELAAPDFTPETGDKELSIDMAIGTVHMTRSLETIGKYVPAGMADVNFNRYINVRKDGERNASDGVDLPGAGCPISATEYVSTSSLTGSYLRNCLLLRFKTNSAPFTFEPDGGPSMTYATGELLYLGLRLSKRGYQDWEAQHQFLFQPNEGEIKIGPDDDPNQIGVPGKKGWEYLWVYYVDALDSVSGMMTKVPRAAFVERVFEEGDYSVL